MQEIWKDVEGYEGLYQVSNLGNVRGLDRVRRNGKSHSQQCFQKGKLLKPAIQKSVGYKFVVLSKQGKTKGFRVHRLVAKAFIPNPNNYPCINHKDENKTNNSVENLEWCTVRYNNMYGTKGLKTSIANSKKVNQYDLDGNLIKKWNSILSAEKNLEINRASVNISACCKNKIKTAYGYKWEYGE